MQIERSANLPMRPRKTIPGEDVDAHRACIADVSQALLCGAFAQGERFDNVQVLYIVSKGAMVSGKTHRKTMGKWWFHGIFWGFT